MGKVYNYQHIRYIFLSLEMKHNGGNQAVLLAREWLNANVSLSVIIYELWSFQLQISLKPGTQQFYIPSKQNGCCGYLVYLVDNMTKG